MEDILIAEEGIACSLTYIISHEPTLHQDESIKECEGNAVLYADRLELASATSRYVANLLDILYLSCSDYRIKLNLADGCKIELFYLGFNYEMFSQMLFRYRNEELIKALLMGEQLLDVFPEAEYSYYIDPIYPACFGSDHLSNGECSIRLYETAIVVTPKYGQILRMPLSFLAEYSLEEYKITVKSELGETLILTQMGFLFEPFINHLDEACKALGEKTKEMIIEYFPGQDSKVIDQLSCLMKEGKAALRSDLEQISSSAWKAFEDFLKQAEIQKEYEFLKGFGPCEDDIHIEAVGIKRGLMGNLTKTYVWLLIPMPTYNLVAFEAAGENSGKATYLFDLDLPEKSGDLLGFLREQLVLFNYCMLAINFRREPIYLSNEQLKKDNYRHYRYAVENIPPLKWLRANYLGRVAHTDKWEENIRKFIEGGPLDGRL